MTSILTINDVSKRFGGLKALTNLSFEVYENQVTAVIGPNGAGKTTLFNLISGLIPIDSGKIIFNRRRIDHLKSYERTKLGIARTFQTLGVFSNMTVIENVMLGEDIHAETGIISTIFNTKKHRKEEKYIREKAVYWLNRMGIEDVKDKNISEIAFEKQRLVEITRAIVSNPKLLLLDEPAAGLNITETRSLISKIKDINDSGITILIVEHDMDMIMEISDRIVVLNFGEKIAEGKPEEIQKNDKVISIYLGTTY
ncbi:MAG: hypothetical protein DRP84_00960 [Spirochaetes bacterium]|nr:MAG: hypothetical protein DRP84_00960 [Spirochaetota bacterium]RKY02171.1 MAG: hypothetical protein DRP55_03255 [Spirochaetota bacterium]